MEAKFSFLGTGWGFPPEFNDTINGVVMASDELDIEESLYILLTTRLGERVMVPKYGCNLEEQLFRPMNLTVKTEIQDLVTTAILYHEPRIDAEKIVVDDSNQLEGELLIDITYKVRATNSRKNFVFPFYKKEATDI